MPPMRELVIQRLIQEFGNPSSDTDKVYRWNLTSCFDLIVQRDASDEQGVVWIPWHEDDFYPDFAELYPAARGRHSNTIHESCPSLARGRTVLKLRIRTAPELDSAVREIRAQSKL